LVIFEDEPIPTKKLMKRSRLELSIDVINIFKKNQTTPFSCFTLIPETKLVFTVVALL